MVIRLKTLGGLEIRIEQRAVDGFAAKRVRAAVPVHLEQATASPNAPIASCCPSGAPERAGADRGTILVMAYVIVPFASRGLRGPRGAHPIQLQRTGPGGRPAAKGPASVARPRRF